MLSVIIPIVRIIGIIEMIFIQGDIARAGKQIKWQTKKMT